MKKEPQKRGRKPKLERKPPGDLDILTSKPVYFVFRLISAGFCTNEALTPHLIAEPERYTESKRQIVGAKEKVKPIRIPLGKEAMRLVDKRTLNNRIRVLKRAGLIEAVRDFSSTDGRRRIYLQVEHAANRFYFDWAQKDKTFWERRQKFVEIKGEDALVSILEAEASAKAMGMPFGDLDTLKKEIEPNTDAFFDSFGDKREKAVVDFQVKTIRRLFENMVGRNFEEFFNWRKGVETGVMASASL